VKRRQYLGALGGAVALGGGYLGYEQYFAPEASTMETADRLADSGLDGDTATSDGATSDDGPAGVLKRGTVTGKAGHDCSGTVILAEDEDGYFLQFRAYEQQQGPDVFCYLTPAPDPDTSAQIHAGEKILIDGGADGGEITKEGTFAQSLPAGIDPTDDEGVGIWCQEFGVPFGAATLE